MMIFGVSLFMLLGCFAFFRKLKRKNNNVTIDNSHHAKIIQLLVAYPVEQYSIAHMLERCLVIMCATDPFKVPAKGMIFLKINEESQTIQRRMSELELNTCMQDWQQKQGSDSHNTCFIAADKHYYFVPLIIAGKNSGFLALYTSINYQPFKLIDDFVTLLGDTLANLVERKHITDEMNISHQMFNDSHQAIFITDKNNQILRSNNACENMTGYKQSELFQQTPHLFRSHYHDESFYQQLWESLIEKGFWQGEIWNKHKQGHLYAALLSISVIKNSSGEQKHYLAIFTDLSEQKQAEQAIHQLAHYDALTLLPNRVLFLDRIQQAISQAARQDYSVVLLMLNIDHFKNINDSFGHDIGDDALKIITMRLKAALREEDTIARVNGDEFGIILHKVSEQEHNKILYVIKKLQDSLALPLDIAEHTLNITCSMGISIFPDDANDADELIKSANIAMHQAQKIGGNQYQFYDEQFSVYVLQKIQMESHLREALKENYLQVHLQPQIHFEPDIVLSAEALLRIKQGPLKALSPAVYIPIAEESDLIIEIGDWVFNEVCCLVSGWEKKGLLPDNFQRVAINISPMQFMRADFIDKVKATLTKTQVSVKHIEVELTESSLQESDDYVIDKLNALKAMGLSIAIDDFGTGYSSLSRLKQFPIDVLKIDRSFISDICHDNHDLEMVKAIINMAHAIDIKALAEGVETENQAEVLGGLKCDYSQGFWHGKSMPSELFTENFLNNATVNE